MQRLAANGMIALGEGRVLHRSPDLAPAADAELDPEKRAGDLRAAAEKSLRMARVLATGGFPDEALPLLGKAIGIAAAAKLATLRRARAGRLDRDAAADSRSGRPRCPAAAGGSDACGAAVRGRTS